MEKSQCPYCHQNIDNDCLADHIKLHRSLRADGQQNDYVTLPSEERFAGDLTGVPVSYVHQKCGVGTRMPDEIVKSYLENPYLYLADSTFCVGCGKQVPYAECNWMETGENLQEYFNDLRAAKPEYRPATVKAVGNASQPTADAAPEAGSFSAGRIVIGAVAVVVMLMIGNLPRAMKRLANQQPAQAVPNNVVPAADEGEQWGEKIRRGEEVPDAILMLAGINPQNYKAQRLKIKLLNLEKNGQYEEKVNAIDMALVEDPDSEYLHNSKAWLLATCGDEKIRNGKIAVDHATKACELTDFKNATYVDTLAAALAEAADFESAVTRERTAMELTTDEAQKQRFAARLALYENKQAFRE